MPPEFRFPAISAVAGWPMLFDHSRQVNDNLVGFPGQVTL